MSNVVPVPVTPSISPLQSLQQAFGLLKLSGAVWVVELADIDAMQAGTREAGLAMYKPEAAKLLMQRHLEALPVKSSPGKVITEFLVSPSTRVYDATAFSPLPTLPKTLNLWVPSPVVPARGDWSVIREFLLDVICDGDRALYVYLIAYLAHMLQRPEEKPGVMIVLLGGQGTGKGTFFELLRAIWPSSTLVTSDAAHVTGGFNAALERSYVVAMDEALFAGDRKAADRLKALVTEPTITIEEKFQPRRSIASFHRFFAASNHAHFAQVDPDDRRYLMLRVSEGRKGDFGYWKKLHEVLRDPAVIAATVHELLGLDLSAFNVRERPRTKELTEQKLASLNGFPRYWAHVLDTGSFHFGGAWTASRFIATSDLLAGWAEFERGTRIYGVRDERDIHATIKKLCPSAKPDRKMVRGCQQRGQQLPDLPLARTDFAAAMGGEVVWDA